MTASWHNIRPEYENNKLRISKDKGKTFSQIVIPSGVYDYEDINDFIYEKIGKLPGDDKNYGINVLFGLTTFKVFIQLDENYQIDSNGSGNSNVLLGFGKELLKTSAYGANFPNISNSIDNIYQPNSIIDTRVSNTGVLNRDPIIDRSPIGV